MTVSTGALSVYDSSVVFKYDVGNTTNSWLGAPTTNLITTNPLPTVGSTTGYSAAGGTGNPITYDSAKQAIYWQRNTYEVWGAYCPNLTNFTGTFNTSLQYTASFEWYSESEFLASLFSWELTDGPSINYVAGANLLSNSTIIGGGWYRFSYTFTPAITGTNANFRVITGDRGTLKTHFWWRKLQLEQSSFRTPFVETTRTASQCLVDLAGAATPTMTNIIYNANNTFSFNGSTSGIYWGDLNALDFGTGDFSLIAVVNMNTAVAGYTSIMSKGSSGVIGYGMQLNNRCITASIEASGGSNQQAVSPTQIATNTWNHCAISYDRAGLIRIYLNGNLDHTSGYNAGNNGSVSNSSVFGVGNYGASWWFPGRIDIVQVHNKALTAEEIKQHFSSIRGRYGI